MSVAPVDAVRHYLEEILPLYRERFGEDQSVQAFRVFMASHTNLTSRRNLAGHVTGSALVWHRSSNSFLRVYHAKLNLWVFSAGGHIDEGELPHDASIRELREETGLTATPLFDFKKPMPFIVTAHPIPVSIKKAEPAHWHYDLVYLFAVDQKPVIDADPTEVSQFRWVEGTEITLKNSPVDLSAQMLRYGYEI